MSDDLDFMPAAPAGSGDPEGDGASSKGADQAGGDPSSSGEDELPGQRAELPTWNRSRRKRKANAEAEKQDDAFQRGVRSASRGAIDYPKLVIGAITIAVLVIAAGVWAQKRGKGVDAEASRDLQAATAAIVRGQVMSEEEQEQAAEALSRYRIPIFTTEEGRQAAIDESLTAARGSDRDGVVLNTALVSAAHAMSTGDHAGALGHYQTFLAEADQDHPLRFLALEGRGIAQEASGELDAALASFEEIAPSPSDYYRPMALYHQGRVLEALERKDEALALYTQYLDEFPPMREEMATPMVRARLEALDPAFAAGLVPPPASPFQMP